MSSQHNNLMRDEAYTDQLANEPRQMTPVEVLGLVARVLDEIAAEIDGGNPTPDLPDEFWRISRANWGNDVRGRIMSNVRELADLMQRLPGDPMPAKAPERINRLAEAAATGPTTDRLRQTAEALRGIAANLDRFRDNAARVWLMAETLERVALNCKL